MLSSLSEQRGTEGIAVMSQIVFGYAVQQLIVSFPPRGTLLH